MTADGPDLEQAAAGDVEAWGRISARHAPMLTAYLGSRIRRPALVERLVIATLVAAWRHLAEAEAGDVSGWLRRHAAGQAMTWARDNPAAGLSDQFPVKLLPQDPKQARGIERLHGAMERLDEPHVRILELVFRGGCSFHDTAEALHVHVDHLPGLLSEAMEALDRIDGSLASA